jgi:hypothetical protein
VPAAVNESTKTKRPHRAASLQREISRHVDNRAGHLARKHRLTKPALRALTATQIATEIGRRLTRNTRLSERHINTPKAVARRELAKRSTILIGNELLAPGAPSANHMHMQNTTTLMLITAS